MLRFSWKRNDNVESVTEYVANDITLPKKEKVEVGGNCVKVLFS